MFALGIAAKGGASGGGGGGTPTLSVTPSSVDVSSGAQTYALTGSNLTANVSVTLGGTNPTAFELSADGATYAASLTVVPSGGNVSQTVHVRRKAMAPGGNLSATAANASAGATTQNVSVSYTDAPP